MQVAEYLNSKPVGALVTLLALISFPLSLWFWWDSKNDPKLTYYVASAPTILARPDILPGLSIQVMGRSIVKPIYAARIYVWNSGRRAIKREDLLPSLRLAPASTTRADIEVLWSNVAVVSREEIQPRLEVRPDGKAVLPNWLILDEDDGFVVDVVYQAAMPVNWQLVGSVAGQKKIDAWANDQPHDSVRKSFIPRPFWFVPMLIAAPFFVFFFGIQIVLSYTPPRSVKRKVGLLALVSFLVLLFFAAYKNVGTPAILLF